MRNNLDISLYAKRLLSFRKDTFFICPNCNKKYYDQKQIVKHFEKCPKINNKPHHNTKTYDLWGRQVSILQIQEEYGLLETTLRKRLQNKKTTMEEALSMGMVNRKNKKVFFNDKEVTLSDFLKEHSVNESYFYKYFCKVPLSSILEAKNIHS